jgi:hypothetical protein
VRSAVVVRERTSCRLFVNFGGGGARSSSFMSPPFPGRDAGLLPCLCTHGVVMAVQAGSRRAVEISYGISDISTTAGIVPSEFRASSLSSFGGLFGGSGSVEGKIS